MKKENKKEKPKKIKVFFYEGAKLPVKAETVGNFLTKLSEKEEEITPKKLVDIARNPKCPIHKCFEWNDTKAAEKYRLDQARNILSCVKIKFITNGKPLTTRAFVNIKSKKGQFYTSIKIAAKNKNYMEYLYDEGKKELFRIKKKYATIKKFNKIFNEINKLK